MKFKDARFPAYSNGDQASSLVVEILVLDRSHSGQQHVETDASKAGVRAARHLFSCQ